MTFSLAAIAQQIGGELRGDGNQLIARVRDVEDAGEGDICVIIDRRFVRQLDRLTASALVLPAGFPPPDRPVIIVANPRRALIRLLALFHPEDPAPAGVEPGALVAGDAALGEGVFVACGARVEAGAVIGPGSAVHANAVIGRGAVLGERCVVFPNVTIYPGVRIGDRVRIHAGTVIGSDGFGYDRDATGVQHKIPQVGTVEIGDDVEIGANCAIDRATMGVTRIGNGTKIDNLVQIGHNCQIGKHCCIIGLAGLSGSVTLGDCCVLAGQAGIADHVVLADGVVVGAQAGVHRDLGPGNWLGSPAIPAEEAYRVYTTLSRLPEMRRSLRALEDRLRALENALDQRRDGDGGPS